MIKVAVLGNLCFPRNLSSLNCLHSIQIFWELMTARNAIQRLIDDCKNLMDLKRIHCQLIRSSEITDHSGRSFIVRLLYVSALSGFRCISYAVNIFTCLWDPDVFVYNIMIRAFASRMDSNSREKFGSFPSVNLYKQMLSHGVLPDYLTFPFLLKECADRGNVYVGLSMHSQVIRLGFNGDIFVNNSLISMYCSSWSVLNSPWKVFEEMPQRDIVSWNSMLIGYLRSGDIDSALALFSLMKHRNIVTWNSMITGLVKGSRPKEALHFFHEMQVAGDDMVRPDKITIASVVSACADLGALDHGRWVHSYMKRSQIECDMVLSTALIDMYGKCGDVKRAFDIFRGIPKMDSQAWTAMVSVFALHGYCEEAFCLVQEMESSGLKPNHVTFVGLLSACAHTGSLEKGRWCFDAMKNVYKLEPQVYHYACMVDMLSRVGLFEEAEALIQTMLIPPDVFVWGALLGGCQMHANTELGERVARHLIELEPLNHAFYVNLCDIYAKAGKFKDVKRIRMLMREIGVQKKVPGCSMIEVDGVIHEFSVKGSLEIQMQELLLIVNWLGDEMKIEECAEVSF